MAKPSKIRAKFLLFECVDFRLTNFAERIKLTTKARDNYSINIWIKGSLLKEYVKLQSHAVEYILNLENCIIV